MRRQIMFTLAIFIVSLLAEASRTYAGVPIFYSWGEEEVIKVVDFPDTDEFKNIEGKYIDAGYRYKHATIFFIPVWNYGGQWCGYIGDSDHYLDLSKADLANLASSIKLPDTPSLPFWDSYGGKLLLLGVLIVGGIAKRSASTG